MSLRTMTNSEISEHDSLLKAMKSEMDSMSENKVWTLSYAPEG